MNNLNQILIILFLTILISCQYAPYAHKHTTIEPKASDLIGIYQFDKQTFDYDLTVFKDSDNRVVYPSIRINLDGTYELINLPVFEIESYDPTYVGLISEQGNWKISTVGSIEHGSENLKNFGGFICQNFPENKR